MGRQVADHDALAGVGQTGSPDCVLMGLGLTCSHFGDLSPKSFGEMVAKVGADYVVAGVTETRIPIYSIKGIVKRIPIYSIKGIVKRIRAL